MWLRRAASATAGGVACGLLVAMAWRQGGYFAEHHLTAGAVAFGTLALLLVLRPPTYRISSAALLAMGSLAALSVWTALSSHWSSTPDTALEDAQRAVVHLGILGLGVFAAGSGRYSRHLLWALLLAIAVIVCGALLSRLYPELVESTPDRFGGYRLSHPLGYWNAVGAMAAMGVVLGAGLAGDPRAPAPGRVLAAALVVPMGVAGYLALSRGAWLAFFLGVAVLLVLSTHRVSLLATLTICGTALLVAVGRVLGYDGLVEGPDAGIGQVAEGRAYGPFLLAIAIIAGAAQFVVGGTWLPRRTRETLPGRARPFVIGLAAALAIGAAGVYALNAGEVEGRSAQGLIGAESWLDRQWDDFMTPAAVGATGVERLTTARGGRSDLYRVAIDGFEARPLIGDGAGGFEVRFAHDRDINEKVRDAHSLYLEIAGELGLVGLVLLLGLLGAIVWAAVLARRRADVLSGAQAAAAAATFAVWAAHAGVDWDWQVPALTGAGLLAAAAMLPAGARRRRGRRRRIDLR